MDESRAIVKMENQSDLFIQTLKRKEKKRRTTVLEYLSNCSTEEQI